MVSFVTVKLSGSELKRERMLDNKSPVGQNNNSNTADGQGSGSELNIPQQFHYPRTTVLFAKLAANPVTDNGSTSTPIYFDAKDSAVFIL